MTDTYELPPLPRFDIAIPNGSDGLGIGYTEQALRAYARLAVKAERERAARIVMSRAPRDGVADATPWLQCAADIQG